jgi:transcriptional regulator with XRE-family HTH domain
MDAAHILALGMKRLRARHGLSQAGLAERAGLSTQYIAALEQQKKGPTLQTLDALAQALGVRVSDLLATGEGREKKNAAQDVSALIGGLVGADRERVLRIVREACAIATASKRR